MPSTLLFIILTIISIFATVDRSSATSNAFQSRNENSQVRPSGPPSEQEESLCLVVDEEKGLVMCTPLGDFIQQLYSLLNGDRETITLDKSLVGVLGSGKGSLKRSSEMTLADFYSSRQRSPSSDFMTGDNEIPPQAIPLSHDFGSDGIQFINDNETDEEEDPSARKSFWRILENKLQGRKNRYQSEFPKGGGVVRPEEYVARKRGKISKLRSRADMNPRPTTSAGRRIFIGFPMFNNVLYRNRIGRSAKIVKNTR